MGNAKVYVDVIASFDPDGRITPLSLKWKDGRQFTIDRVTDVRSAAATKAGGQGDRYAVLISGRNKYLFFERNTSTSGNNIGRWFVESTERRG